MKRYYPWVICVTATVMLTVSNGLTVTGITAFDEPLLNEFGWSRGTLKFRDMLNLLLTGLMAPFVGALIDRVGVRALILTGSLLLAALYLAYSHVHSILQLYLIHVGFAAVLLACGLNVAVIMVSQWFETRRGTALGIALAGSSLGGMLIPKLVVTLLPQFGWRDSFMWMALLPTGLFFLCLWLVRSPKQSGFSPLRAAAPVADSAAGSIVAKVVSYPDLNYRQALGTRTFWALAVIALTTFYGILALSAHLMLHMRDLGFSLQHAGNGMMVLFGMGMVGKFVFGFLADTFHPKKVFVSNQLLMLGGAILLASQQVGLLWYGLFLFGLGWGGLYALLQLQLISAFGITAAGKILGTVTLMDAVAAGLGIWLSAVMFDHYGNYHLAFNIIAVFVGISFLCSLLVREERRLAFERNAAASSVRA
ncbi:MAG: MFS transporter [Rhodanobacter sp.]